MNKSRRRRRFLAPSHREKQTTELEALMAKLSKFTLFRNPETTKWDLKRDSGETVKSFKDKLSATKGGALQKAIGGAGGSVKIKKLDGKIQEERTFPGSADPRSSKG
jgi:hypothetical protein